MAEAVMRYSKEVFPAPEGWRDGGGEMSSRIGGPEGRSVFSCGMVVKL
jgi:hypothetical protein